MKKISILGVEFTDMTLLETKSYLSDVLKAESNHPFHLITANPEIVMQINRSETFKEIEVKSGLITPDGIGIIYGAKILGHKIPERVTGVELLLELFDLSAEEGFSMYFLGADETTIQEFRRVLSVKYPKVNIVGFRNGYFDVNDDMEIIQTINKIKPDILVMGMGSPRSHLWFHSRRDQLKIKMVFDVGGGFDAITGKVKRAPQIIQKMNIEWLYRRIQDPSRANRQKDLYRFGMEVIQERFRKVKKYS